jgi:flagellar biosynthesis component FlhA
MEKLEKAQKVGEFLLDIAKITFAGLIISKLPVSVSENEFTIGVISFILLMVVGFILIFIKGGKK